MSEMAGGGRLSWSDLIYMPKENTTGFGYISGGSIPCDDTYNF